MDSAATGKDKISFVLDRDIHAALDDLARERRWTPSQTIREAIYRFLLVERSLQPSPQLPVDAFNHFRNAPEATSVPREDMTTRSS